MIKNYKFGVDIYSLLLFLIIMLPNFIWFAIPAPNDILRTDSVTPIVDAIGSFCHIFFISLFRKVFSMHSSGLKLYIVHIYIIFIHFQLCLIRNFFCSLDPHIQKNKELILKQKCVSVLIPINYSFMLINDYCMYSVFISAGWLFSWCCASTRCCTVCCHLAASSTSANAGAGASC